MNFYKTFLLKKRGRKNKKCLDKGYATNLAPIKMINKTKNAESTKKSFTELKNFLNK